MTSPLLFDCSKDEQSFHVVEVAVSPLTQVLSYRVPTESPISVGFRVSVPLGNRTTFGVVIRRNVKEHSLSQGFQLKAVHGDETPIPVLHPSQLPFLEWIADYYGDSLSSVIDTCIPNIALPKPVEMLSINSTQESLDLKGSKQKQIVAFLRERGGEVLSSELRKIFPSSGQSLLTLKKKGIVQSSLRAHVPWYKNSNREAHPSLLSPPQLILSPEQERARIEIESALENEEFLPVLLHGVTGSGKTEVYIQTIHTARKKGLGALVLVPEIALTPQLVDRFRAHFGDQVAVLHSALDKRARWEMWEGILKGELPIVIGARSAIFAPLPRLGIVVVDEEHDSSFKQAERFRYNGRDLAVKRAQLCSCPVVLGSATPSLESFYNAAQKRYRYLPLPNRAGTAEHNTFTVVNLNSVKRKEMISKNISPKLFHAIRETLDRGQQIFILYNRRGFASYLQCEECAKALECPNCSVTFTYHKGKDALLCHYCGLKITPPKFCPTCQSTSAISDTPPSLKLLGAGTERVFDELRELFPEAAIERLDRDTANDLEAYKTILGKLRREETQILVGTQMIAKGHDLPSVTLVGVVDCDVGLHMPDFRASERNFQLLTQAAGRAGRASLQGHVVLQTRSPHHPSIVMTEANDYVGFAKQELACRKSLFYPPFTRMVRIVSASALPELAGLALEEMRKLVEKVVQQNDFPVTILGPTPAPFEKLKTKWRWHMLLKCHSAAHASLITKMLKTAKINSTRVTITFDLDPQDML